MGQANLNTLKSIIKNRRFIFRWWIVNIFSYFNNIKFRMCIYHILSLILL